MPNDALIQVRIDAKKKTRAMRLFKRFGLSTSDAVRMFINQALEEKALPFLPHIPNDETLKALAAEVEPMDDGGLEKIWNGV